MKYITSTTHHRTSRNFVIGFLSLALLVGCKDKKVVIESVECVNLLEASDIYDYPILPGTQEWAAMPTVAERVEACQIPQDKLTKMSTEGLIGSWVTFPFTLDILALSTYQSGIEHWMNNFSGLQELTKRPAAGARLLEYYEKMRPACVASNASSYPSGNFSFVFIELLIAQDVVLNKLTQQQKKELVAEALEKDEQKKLEGDESVTALFVCARTMKNAGYSPFISELNAGNSENLNLFIQHGQLIVSTNNEIATILQHARNFSK